MFLSLALINFRLCFLVIFFFFFFGFQTDEGVQKACYQILSYICLSSYFNVWYIQPFPSSRSVTESFIKFNNSEASTCIIDKIFPTGTDFAKLLLICKMLPSFGRTVQYLWMQWHIG